MHKTTSRVLKEIITWGYLARADGEEVLPSG